MADELPKCALGRESPSNTGYGIATRGVGARFRWQLIRMGRQGANLGIAVGGSLLASIPAWNGETVGSRGDRGSQRARTAIA